MIGIREKEGLDESEGEEVGGFRMLLVIVLKCSIKS